MMANKVFLGSTSLAPIKPRQQKAATEQSLGGHPRQSDRTEKRLRRGDHERQVTREVSPGTIKGESATGSCSAPSNLGSMRSSVSSRQTQLPYVPETLL